MMRVIPLDYVPADVMRAHILPHVLPWSAPVDKGEVRALITFVLGLRTLNRKWRTYVDKCEAFWLYVMPAAWPPMFQLRAKDLVKLKKKTPFQVVMEMAKKHAGWVYGRKRSVLENKRERIERKIEMREQEIENMQEEQRAIDVEVEEFEAKLKKTKQ